MDLDLDLDFILNGFGFGYGFKLKDTLDLDLDLDSIIQMDLDLDSLGIHILSPECISTCNTFFHQKSFKHAHSHLILSKTYNHMDHIFL